MENRIAAAIRKKMAETDTPFYLYDQVTIRDRAQQLRRDFADCEFLYSIKTNPFLPVVQTLVGEGFGIDAASLREVAPPSEWKRSKFSTPPRARPMRTLPPPWTGPSW